VLDKLVSISHVLDLSSTVRVYFGAEPLTVKRRTMPP
jgi:hypothetical protein